MGKHAGVQMNCELDISNLEHYMRAAILLEQNLAVRLSIEEENIRAIEALRKWKAADSSPSRSYDFSPL